MSFVTGKGRKPRAIKLQPIVWDLGKARTTALPVFQAISGANNIGCFSDHAVPLCWTAFLNVNDGVVGEMAKLGTNTICWNHEGYRKVCMRTLCTKDMLSKVKDLRWWLFRKNQVQSENLPPAQDTLHDAVLRAHNQVTVWNNDIVAHPGVPSPKNYGWEKHDNR